MHVLKMFKNIEKIFKSLVWSNFFISIIITFKIFMINNYHFLEVSAGLIITSIYASVWFYSLYKIYNFSKSGLRIYISLTLLGFLFNILSNLSYLDKTIYLLTVTEHMIIGSILTFSYFSKIKSKFK
tara:strand:+ start:8 stop:388 length:381 start_codon:yes stop_codon:yes gene_type:complete